LPPRISRRSLLTAYGTALVSTVAWSLPAIGMAARTGVSSVTSRATNAKAHAASRPSLNVVVHSPVLALAAAPATRGARAGASAQLARLPSAIGVPDHLQFLPANAAVLDDGAVLARIRLFGDMHFGFTSAARLSAVATDLATQPPPDALLTTGDETHFGLPEEYAAAQDWLRQWPLPLHTVTGNHTFWNASLRHRESAAALYQRFVATWGQPMPNAWELGGVRFIGVGPTTAGATPAGASLLLDQVDHLAGLLALAPHQPTVVVMHSPLHHTVLGDGGPPNSVYTSDDPGFYQINTDPLLAVLAGAPQVALLITGHTHSPLKASGLLAPVHAGATLAPQFNAMALPFVRRGPRYTQDLVTWELAITRRTLLLTGRDHLARRDVARAIVPLPDVVAGPWLAL
jgi:hypothetical protein